MYELLDHLTWAPPLIILTVLLAALVFFGFLMGRMTQDKPIIKHKLIRPKKMPVELPDGDIFRDAMAGDDKGERISTIRPE